MKKKLLAFTLPAGLLIEFIYLVGSRFFAFPDIIAYPIMAISVVLMVVGLAYFGYCFGKKENPYKFK